MGMTSGNREIGWGVIGCGDVVDRKAGAALRTIPGSRIVTVMRRSADEARAFAQRHGVAQWTTDADQVIEHPDVNAIYVATPPEHHLEYALAVCAAGKACLVEKPAGRSESECRQMVEVFKQAGVPLYISYYRRYLAKFRQVKQIVANGELGAIVAIHYRMAKPHRACAVARQSARQRRRPLLRSRRSCARSLRRLVRPARTGGQRSDQHHSDSDQRRRRRVDVPHGKRRARQRHLELRHRRRASMNSSSKARSAACGLPRCRAPARCASRSRRRRPSARADRSRIVW